MSGLVPIVRAAGEGDKRSFLGGGTHLWKLLAEETGGEFFLFEDEMVGGKCTPLHCHPEAHETTYLLEGEILVTVDGNERRLGPGTVSFVPRGVPHAFLVLSERARLLSLQTPGVGQGFYRDASEPATDDATQALDLDRLRQSAEANPRGIALLGPPPFERVTTS